MLIFKWVSKLRKKLKPQRFDESIQYWERLEFREYRGKK